MAVSDQVRELETHLSHLRVASAFLLDQDGWDRWGRRHASAQEIDERMARERQMIELRDASIAALAVLVPTLRTTAPEAIACWADAHDTLLAKFIAVHEATPNGFTTTSLDVARREREEWQAVKRGEQLYVDGNTYYVQLDRELYRELFGIIL